MKLSMPFGSDRGRSREGTPEAGMACGETKVAHWAQLVCCFASFIPTFIYSRPTLRLDPLRTRPEPHFLSLLTCTFFLVISLPVGLSVNAYAHANMHARTIGYNTHRLPTSFPCYVGAVWGRDKGRPSGPFPSLFLKQSYHSLAS